MEERMLDLDSVKEWSDEVAAYQLLKSMRWGKDMPVCQPCKTARNIVKNVATDDPRMPPAERFAFRCRTCKTRFTVRTGTVFRSVGRAAYPLSLYFAALASMSDLQNSSFLREYMASAHDTSLHRVDLVIEKILEYLTNDGDEQAKEDWALCKKLMDRWGLTMPDPAALGQMYAATHHAPKTTRDLLPPAGPPPVMPPPTVVKMPRTIMQAGTPDARFEWKIFEHGDAGGYVVAQSAERLWRYLMEIASNEKRPLKDHTILIGMPEPQISKLR